MRWWRGRVRSRTPDAPAGVRGPSAKGPAYDEVRRPAVEGPAPVRTEGSPAPGTDTAALLRELRALGLTGPDGG